MVLAAELTRRDPTLDFPPWPLAEQHYSALPVSDLHLQLLAEAALAALQRFLPCNDQHVAAADKYSCDDFRMYEFKVRRCPRGRSHVWTECPYLHPGEKARRRDPRRFHYSGSPCPDFRRGGGCRRGDACELAHGVFETWLHPERYRTEPCKDGATCRRRVCFFAHSPVQLRVVLPPSPTSPGKGDATSASSPTSTLAPKPMSPQSHDSSPPVSLLGVGEVVTAMRKLQLNKVRSERPFSAQRGAGFPEALGSAPVTPRSTAAAGREEAAIFECWMRKEEATSEAVPDFGWVLDLVED